MKHYKIIYTETLVHHFYIEAEDEDGALSEFDRMLFAGELDFSDGEVIDTATEVREHDEATYTAFIYDDDIDEAEDFQTWDNREQAIEFAEHFDWDEVVNDITGEVVWRRGDRK